MTIMKLNLGCGNVRLDGYINFDLIRFDEVDVVGDGLKLPFKDNVFDEIRAIQVLEHFENPCDILDEMWRVVKRDGKVYVQIPLAGSGTAHLDLSHKFKTDGYVWSQILSGYFESISFSAEGLKHQFVNDKWKQRLLNQISDGYWDLAQNIMFKCSSIKDNPKRLWHLRPWKVDEDKKRLELLKKEIVEELKGYINECIEKKFEKRN